GDGDLAAIGMTEIIHAANRGEIITVIFVNNATYGMTSGQMAPTTPLNQKTLTTPYGRSFENDGLPIDMCKLIDSLDAPVFIQRCSVSNTKEIVKTKKAIRKGLENQINRVGFSFIEILSPCPTNWKMSAIEARSYIDETLSQIFELKTFRDKTVKREQKKKNWLNESDLYNLLADFMIKESSNKSLISTAEKKIIIAGFGGQGILFAARLLAICALIEKRELSYLPSYGPEMRGGNARVDVIISPASIGSPLIDECDCFVAFNQSSYDSFVDKVKEKGVVIKNTSLVKNHLATKKLTEIGIAATEIAQKFGMPQGANIVLITALIFQTKLFLTETLKQGLSLILKQQEKLTKNWNLVEQTMLLLSN
ncbi:MAG: 2-oxoacid:acceptor oxidoreductase family protein, partial [Sphaerochaetaceae bacterium]